LPSKKGRRNSDHFRGTRYGTIYQCEDGYFTGGRHGGWAYDNQGQKIKQFPGDGGKEHVPNFIQAVRSRNKDNLIAEIGDAYLSAVLCHLANISWRTGQIADPENTRKALEGIPEAAEAFQRMTQHLKANEIDSQKEPVITGPWLKLNRDFSRFDDLHNNPNQKQITEALLTKSYRKPFVVPDAV